jgi:glycosyltransferase involved in cell wall biosynthesis
MPLLAYLKNILRPDQGERFAIIIPTLNPGEKLRRSLDAIEVQTGVSRDVVVVDGGSQDGSLDCVESHPCGARLISAPGSNVYEAMNLGIQATSAPILYFLGAGDCLRAGILAKILAGWPRGKYLMVYGDVWMQDLARVYDGEFTARKLSKQNICHQAIFYSRAVFQRHGGYETCFPVLADYAMNLRVFGDPKVRKIYRPWIIADYEGNGKSAHNADPAFQAEKAARCELHLGILPNKKRAALELARRRSQTGI